MAKDSGDIRNRKQKTAFFTVLNILQKILGICLKKSFFSTDFLSIYKWLSTGQPHRNEVLHTDGGASSNATRLAKKLSKVSRLLAQEIRLRKQLVQVNCSNFQVVETTQSKS